MVVSRGFDTLIDGGSKTKVGGVENDFVVWKKLTENFQAIIG